MEGIGDLVQAAKTYHFDQAQGLWDRMHAHRWDARGPVYIAPHDDDPATWEGIAEFVYMLWSYEWHIEAEVDLARLGKPFLCLECGDKKKAGWQPRLCFDHAFDSFGYDEVLRRSRSLDPRRKAKVAA